MGVLLEGRWRNGRRSGLKIRRGNPRVGSNPTRPIIQDEFAFSRWRFNK